LPTRRSSDLASTPMSDVESSRRKTAPRTMPRCSSSFSSTRSSEPRNSGALARLFPISDRTERERRSVRASVDAATATEGGLAALLTLHKHEDENVCRILKTDIFVRSAASSVFPLTLGRFRADAPPPRTRPTPYSPDIRFCPVFGRFRRYCPSRSSGPSSPQSSDKTDKMVWGLQPARPSAASADGRKNAHRCPRQGRYRLGPHLFCLRPSHDHARPRALLRRHGPAAERALHAAAVARRALHHLPAVGPLRVLARLRARQGRADRRPGMGGPARSRPGPLLVRADDSPPGIHALPDDVRGDHAGADHGRLRRAE